MHFPIPFYATSLLAIFITRTHCTATATLDALTKNLSSVPLESWYNFTPFPKTLIQQINQDNNNKTQTPPLHAAGCYSPEPRATYVSPKDATIALGLLATTPNFFTPKPYYRLS
ncbi:MAG: hypothetical protein Q9218_008261, partial [Villophora microphyllina]